MPYRAPFLQSLIPDRAPRKEPQRQSQQHRHKVFKRLQFWAKHGPKVCGLPPLINHSTIGLYFSASPFLVSMYIHIYVCECIHVDICVCIYVCVSVCMYIHSTTLCYKVSQSVTQYNTVLDSARQHQTVLDSAREYQTVLDSTRQY